MPWCLRFTPALHFFLCQFHKPFFLSPHLHSFPFYPSLPLSLILAAVKAEQTACSQNKTECGVSESEPQHFHLSSLFHPPVTLFLIKRPTCFSVLFGRVSNAGTLTFILLSFLFPLQKILCSTKVWYMIPTGIHSGRWPVNGCRFLGLLTRW